ncbi:MAG TPA: SUMF1/EgtB/PvdO family nonheme iron enzyme [Micromonosporaceae bacterium]
MPAVSDLLDNLDWVEVPAGELLMGTPEEELPRLWERVKDLPVERSWFLKECPRRTVRVDRFVIARVPLTVAQFSALAVGVELPATVTGKPDHPVAVPYAVAERLVCRLADATGRPVRLPAEEQWERAARGDDDREYPWGDKFRPELANIGEGSQGDTTPVGSYPAGASPFGVLDMAGNLDEWTSTGYAPYPGAPTEVPEVESWALDPHVTRGGGWNHGRDAARCARRHGLYGPGPVGLRLALDT